MAKSFSELTVFDVKSFLRIDYSLDDDFIEMALDSARSYICQYTKRSSQELNGIPEISMATLVLTAHFYDNRSLETDTETLNYTIGKMLGLHWFYMSDSQMEE